MSKQYKKLQNKIHPKEEPTEKKNEKPVGKDYVLLFIIVFTLFILCVSWEHFDNMKRIMYICLTAALGLTYAGRHAKLDENQLQLVNRASFVTLMVSIVLFLVSCYNEFFA